MVVVDANILVRWLTQDDERLARNASYLIEQAKMGSLWLDRLTLAELTYVLKSNYQLSKLEVVTNLRGLLADDHFMIPDREITELTVELFESEKPLSFEDCWLLALKRIGKVLSVATFDKDLQARVDVTLKG